MTEIVAEISGNHGGSLANAGKLIAEAAWAGADAIKFQCFDPRKLALKRCENPEILKLAGIPSGIYGADKYNALLELYRQTHTPREWFPRLIELANVCEIAWFSSVFDPDDVAFLETLDCPRYKISAFEMLDWELIKAVKETGKPIVMSVRPTTGVTILQATDYNGQMKPFGISDHGIHEPLYGVPMVEWHLKLEGVSTPDSEFSLTSSQMRACIQAMRQDKAA